MTFNTRWAGAFFVIFNAIWGKINREPAAPQFRETALWAFPEDKVGIGARAFIEDWNAAGCIENPSQLSGPKTVRAC